MLNKNNRKLFVTSLAILVKVNYRGKLFSVYE